MIRPAAPARRLVRVLVIDDSAFVRQTIRALLLSSSEIDVVGAAADGDEGLRLVEALDPDVITLDLEMPRLDGFAFLRILMRKGPRAVIVVSALHQRHHVLRALELGALDFVAKPDREASPSLRQIRTDLVAKVLSGAGSRIDLLRARAAGASRELVAVDDEPAPRPPTPERRCRPAPGLIVVGTSTGGPSTLRALGAALPGDLPWGVLVALHMPPRFTRAYAERLDREVALRVVEAQAGDAVSEGTLYVAPGGSHLEVVGAAEGFALAVRPPQPDDRYVPSVDRLFSSAAEAGGRRVVGVVLTGMGSDGVLGAQYVRLNGGTVIAEDESTAVVFGMPRASIAAGAVHEVLPLDRIGPRLEQLVGRRL